MRGFTLIELLVVLIIFAIIVSLTAPKGSKLLDTFINFTNRVEKRERIKLLSAYSFIQAKTTLFQDENGSYFITKRGLIIEKKSNVNY